MSELSVKEVEDFLERHEDDHGVLGWYGWEELLNAAPRTVKGLGTVKVVDHFGGEGQGDDYYLVFEVTPPDDVDGPVRYFKMNGYHRSFDGSYYDGPFVEVRSVRKLVTVYE